MKNSNYGRGDDLGQEILDKITDAMSSMDFDKLSDSIQKSVNVIQKEADRGYQNIRQAADSFNNKPNSGADQSWFAQGGAQNGTDSASYTETGSYNYSDGAHRSSSGQYSYQYTHSGNGPHRASSGQYGPGAAGNVYSSQGSENGGNAPSQNHAANKRKKKPASVIKSYPGNVSSLLEIALGVLGLTTFVGFSMAALAISPGILGWICLLVLLGVNVGFLFHGHGRQKRLKRFHQYNQYMMGKDYCMLEDMAKACNQPLDQVKKDIKLLMDKSCMPGVTMDKNETCLMFTENAKKQYEDAEYAKKLRDIEEAHQKAMEEAEALKRANATKEEKAWMQFDDDYKSFYQDLGSIRQEMDTPVMKAHVEKIDELLTRVYDCVKDHKEMIGSTGHLTSYYFPCMSKLFHTYLDLEEQPIEGDNIQKTKKEIEASFDTIETALTNMYDEMFTNISMDISSDIQVLKTMMARDGWGDMQLKADRNADADPMMENGNIFAASQEQNAVKSEPEESDFQKDFERAQAMAAQAAEQALQSEKAEQTLQPEQEEQTYSFNSGYGAAGAFAAMPEEKKQ